jgi:hypothetical protein
MVSANAFPTTIPRELPSLENRQTPCDQLMRELLNSHLSNLTPEHTFGIILCMETQTLTRTPQLAARLLELDSAIASLQTERFHVLAEIRSLDEAEGKSERQTAVFVAQVSRSSARFAAAEVRLARNVDALPEVREALRTGAISRAQLGAVVTIATPDTQAETILLAQQLSNADLERTAAVRRGKLAEERQKVQKERFLSFTKHGDQTTIRGSLPFLEGSEMEQQLRKIADRLYLGQEDRPAPSARMLDALLIFMKHKPTNALAESTAAPVTDFDEEPFPETAPEPTDFFGNSDHTYTNQSTHVFKSDTRIIIHWNAQTGTVNYENGPPIDHPRLTALLCDAKLEIQHHNATGQPTGLTTTAYHANWRQDRYLAHRDGPCRIPNCPGIGKTQAHHLFEHRTDRTTDTKYMINLCNYDHGQHHDGNITITGNPEGTITFTYPNGRQIDSHARPATKKTA